MMLNTTTSQSKYAELRHRIFVVLLAVLVFRVGAYIPVPGLDPVRLAELFRQNQNSIIGLLSMFSGGALARFTVFALGLMPYISASIIVQLLSSIVPSLEQLKKEGDSGRRKISQYTRYATIGLSSFQAIGIARYLIAQGIVVDPSFMFYIVTALTLVTGTMFLMWLGEQVTERGIGNGISILIFAGIVSGLPVAFARFFEQVRQGQIQVLAMGLIIAIMFFVTAFVVYMERAQRRIPVNYARRQQGRKMYAAQSTHLPLKINMSGVIPPIFASSIILFPGMIAKMFGEGQGMDWLGDLGYALSSGQPLYLICYAAAIIFFAFFYTALVFNPKDTAENLKKSGAFIQGIRPGESTAKYIDTIMSRLTMIGAMYIVLVCLLPEIMVQTWHVPFYFGGTSLLIIVVVVMDFIGQIQSHLLSNQYESLMKKVKIKKSTNDGRF
jgi:preprotein translocase subunit SecY